MKPAEVNDARYQIFCAKYDSPKEKKVNIQVKEIDGRSLPPCKSAFVQQVSRANCLCSIWNNAYSFQTTMFPPDQNEWNLNQDESGDNYFNLNWFHGEMIPKKLEDIQQNESPNDEEGEDEEIQEMDNESEEEEATEKAAEDEDLAADD
jgi:hypothetical protein